MRAALHKTQKTIMKILKFLNMQNFCMTSIAQTKLVLKIIFNDPKFALHNEFIYNEK